MVRLIVSIDTEEDNWAPVSRDVTTRNIAQLPGLERRFEALGVRATYFTNYQVLHQPDSAAVMRDIHAGGRAEVAAHLHPWNTPPRLDLAETMLLNLPPDVQASKISTVTQALTELLGAPPRAFRAGRFGLGPNTVRALVAAGYAIDSSVTPFFSWQRFDHGPSYVGAPANIYRLETGSDVRVPGRGPLIEVPLSCGYNRWHPASWPRLHAALSKGVGSVRLAGIAARLNIARAVILSPEVHDTADLYGLADSLLAGGLPFLQVFWHSPSMTPGLSPFCRTARDVEELLARFEELLERLSRRATMRFVTISEAVAELEALAPAVAPAARFEEPAPAVVSTVVEGAESDVETGIPLKAPAGAIEPAEAAPAGRMGWHTAVYLGGILLGRAVSFFMLPFYTHYLTPADYGIMQLLDMTLDIIAIVAGTRIASGIHRYYFKARNDEDRRSVLSTALVLLAVSFTAFGAITWILAEPLTTLVLGSAEHAGLMRIAAVTFALHSMIIVPFAILQLWKRSVLLTAVSTGRLVIQLTLNIVLLAGVGLGLKSVFISSLIANLVVGALLTATLVRKIGLRWSGPAAGSLLRYGLPLVGTQFAMFFVTYGDRYFLRVSADVAQVGLYSLAYQFGFIVAHVGYVPFAMVWEPTRFQVAERPDRDALYSRAFIFMNVLQLLATVGCVLFVRDFIYLMTDDAYHSAHLIVPIILVAYVLQSWAYFHEVGILIRERTGWVTFANWIAAAVAFVGYAVLIPRWLAWGAAVTTVLAFLVRWIITYITAQRLLPVRYDWAPVWRLVAVSAAFSVVGIALPHPSVAASLAMRVALLGAYVWALWHIGVFRPDEKARILSAVRSPRAAIRSLLP